MTRRQEWAAIIGTVSAIAIVSALAGHHMGVSHGIGEAALIRDEARVTMEACYEALESAERTALVTLSAQETFREVRAERMEAMDGQALVEVDDR